MNGVKKMIHLTEEKFNTINDAILNISLSDNIKILSGEFLCSIQQVIDFDQASFFLYDRTSGYYCTAAINIADKHLNEFSEYYHEVDEVTLNLTTEKSYRYTDFLMNKDRSASEAYNDHFKPMGAYYSQGLNLSQNTKQLGIVTLFRDKNSPDFNSSELYLMEIFYAHLTNKIDMLCRRELDFTLLHKMNESRITLKEQFGLTDREIEIVDRLLNGLSNQEIADTFYIELYTVKTHLKNIFRKLCIKNRSQILPLLLKSTQP